MMNLHDFFLKMTKKSQNLIKNCTKSHANIFFRKTKKYSNPTFWVIYFASKSVQKLFWIQLNFQAILYNEEDPIFYPKKCIENFQ